MDARQLIIVGASGFGSEVFWLAKRLGREVVGFLDDTPQKQGQTFMGVPILGPVIAAAKYSNSCEFVVAIGAPRSRQIVAGRLTDAGHIRFATLIDPAAIVPDMTCGPGTVVCAGVVSTVSVVAGAHVIINLNSTLGHGVQLGDFVTVAPLTAVSGNVVLEELVEIGTGAAIREKIRVGRGAVVGMGGVVVKDVPAETVVVGNPARPICKDRSAAS